MKRAIRNDRAIIIKILLESFKDDPYLHWITKASKNPNKLKYLIEYVVDDTFDNGEIYLSDNNMATALWNFQKTDKLTLNFIWRNILFYLRFRVKATVSILRKDIFTHKQYPAFKKFYHLYLIGVLPEGQGKGLASELMNPVLNKCSQESIPVLLETANPLNVKIYSKKGFTVCNTTICDDRTIYYMKKAA